MDNKNLNQDSPEQNSEQTVIPKHLLNQLNEHCIGGFVLFCLDQDGSPQALEHYEQDIHAIGLHSFVQKWGNCHAEIDEQILMHSLIGCDCEDEE